MYLLYLRFLAALGNKKAIRRECAARITAAFEGVDWTKQSFCVGHEFLTTTDGERHFYKVSEIDPAIKRLNEVLTDLRT